MIPDRIQTFLQRLTPLTRSNLLTELERMEICGSEMPGIEEIVDTLRAEFRKDGSTKNPLSNSSRYFFAPLLPLTVDSAPELANPGRIQRGSLFPIWEWISRDLLPTMARDYVSGINKLIATNSEREAQQAAATFQIKVLKSIENTLGSPDAADQIRSKLAAYTASPAIYGDLTKMLGVLRARDDLAKFNDALPDKILKFDDARVASITALLNGFAKKHPEAVPFALTLVAKRLRTPWQLIRLATKAAPGKNAADIATTPYAIAVSMVLDQMHDRRLALRIALKNNRVLVAKEILTDIYDAEYALQVRIDLLEQSGWGERLSTTMNAIADLVATEVSRFPDKIGHVLGSRSLHSHQSLAGRLTYLAWKGRDVMSEGAAYCKKLIGQQP